MQIEPFGVEIWMNEFETKCELNLAETCVHSLSIAELLALTGRNDKSLADLLPMKMTYGAIEGSERLQNAIAALYAAQDIKNIITTHGTIGANMLVHKALVSPGDRVIAIVPTYQQHYSIPASMGANVQLLHLNRDNNYLPDLDALRTLASPGTKLIAMTNPNNPTGSLMDEAYLSEVIEIARNCGAWLLCDEVYRGTNQEGLGTTASVADLYEKGISTAGTSKAFSLAGLRVGWIAAPREVIEAVMIHRDYNTISVGVLDEYFAAIAIEHSGVVLQRSRSITRDNLDLLSSWMAGEPRMSWVKPRAGTVTLLHYDVPLSSREFCTRLLEEEGVLLTPGSAFDLEGCVRIGFGNSPEAMARGLPRLAAFLKRHG
jgi:aspartate/methionine/tyrosine aminotransferase